VQTPLSTVATDLRASAAYSILLVPLRHDKGCDRHDPVVHYGLITSGNKVIKNAALRDELRDRHNITCFEIEATGLMNTLPVAIIRGISDYADSHKNDQWQLYAAATAAAYAKGLLKVIRPGSLGIPPSNSLPKPTCT
jgi:nucleoside phosphorylase